MAATVDVSDEERHELVKICGDYLRGDWEQVNVDEVFCGRIPYGVCNKTYLCYIKNKQHDCEFNDVIIHVFQSGVFGENNAAKHLGEAAEVAIMQRLHQFGMAPKLYAVFPGGRIEEYIHGRTPTREEHAGLELSKAVVRKIAEYHSMDSMPVLKRPHLIDKICDSASKVTVTDEELAKFTDKNAVKVRQIMGFRLKDEYEWIKRRLPIFETMVVFSHNDMNPNNVLLKYEEHDSLDKRLVLIDYETSTYFYRAFDVAYFVNFKALKARNDGKNVVIEMEKLDTQFKNEILVEYLKESKRLNKNQVNEKFDNLDWFRKEVDFFSLVSFFYIISLGRSIIKHTTLIFPMDWIASLVTYYESEKKELLEQYGDPLEWSP